jgi:hypothetical protein
MQTLHLRFRDLRAISLGHSPSRWRTRSMPAASAWKGASPLPNLPRPTWPVGAASDAMRAGMKGPPGLSNSPGPTCAVGWRPAMRPPVGIRCPVAGAGSPGVPPLRAARIGASTHCDGPVGADPCRVCPRQTARDPVSHPARQMAGDAIPDHGQARASESQRLASGGLSFPLVPRRFGARSCEEKTADPIANVGASARISSGAQACSRHGRGEGAWPATTSP